MNIQEFYEEFYRRERGRSPQEMMDEETRPARGLYHFVVESKNRFLPNLDWSQLKILEMGSGRGGLGLLLAKLGAHVTLIDFSRAALDQAEMIFSVNGLSAKTFTADVRHPDIQLREEYDIIVDSHLLHCLTEDPDRSSYYRLISDYLSPSGIFVAESMVHRKKLYIPDGFMFDERNVLWQMFSEWTPVRRILDSLDLEKELNEASFHIAYFYYYGQYGFVPHKNFMEIPAEILPAAVRMVLKLPSKKVGEF